MTRSWGEPLLGAVVLSLALGFLFWAMTAPGGPSATEGGRTLTARFYAADGILPGSPVRIAGVPVGRVTGLDLDRSSFQAVVTLELPADLPILDDASLKIASEGLLGGRYLALDPGGAGDPLTEGGEIRLTQAEPNLTDLLGRAVVGMGGGSTTPPAEGGTGTGGSP